MFKCPEENNMIHDKIINSMVQNIAIIDKEGNLILTNNQWDDFYRNNGGSKETCGIGINYFDVCMKSYKEGGLNEMLYVIENIQLVLNREKNLFTYEYSCHSPNERRWFVMYVTPLHEETNYMNCAVIVHLDITNKKFAEEQAKYQERVSAIGQVVSSLADEIRNPLTILKGFWYLFDDHSHNLKAFSEVIIDEINKIEEIINRFLAISDPINEKFEKVNINELLLETIKLIDFDPEKHDIIHSYRIVQNSITVPVIRSQIITAFSNIIKNALSSMPNGGKLSINIDVTDGNLTIEFLDEGCGIPKQLLSKLGEPFYLLSKHGNGLGLMIVQQIINKHKGSVAIESEVNKGTSVKIYLPMYENSGR
ncbi:hypothetical protein BKP37_08415 [Anaerobacillus alkalilacustris]|uniref:histidine kinase n=1 Tax=Anaerobacillus alkalilacustris TaxID=393763 RepID=A0A1S2LPF4_9BACI|nr:ATP-binding protein [Anaerobacillus alkalilacustris]OIJ14361.1 hypothetical protein BKP37_08415 [Anaerobacillus alkalilacustris]